MTAKKIARTLRSVLRECEAPPIIDYWSLDTEGSELTLLKSFPFDDYSFRVVTLSIIGCRRALISGISWKRAAISS